LEHATTDAFGVERHHWGFMAQTTFQVTDAIKLAASYGANHSDLTDYDRYGWAIEGGVPKKCQEAIIGQINYNLTKFIQFSAEYVYAKDTWQDKATRYSNQATLGTVFYW
jgi:hypothetical protein